MGVDAFDQSNTAKMQRRIGSRQGTGELYYKSPREKDMNGVLPPQPSAEGIHKKYIKE